MRIDARQSPAGTVLTVDAPRIDAAAAVAFKDAFRACVAGGDGPVILDLGRVEFVDSSGLGAVVSAMKMLAPRRRLDLAALHPAVDRVFRLTRMDSVFAIHDRAPADG
ncbi:STAS domain-containing protein [Hasllibacter halocynthiae]|nr:STAS domain-containing protein [Hasllibacter halocynthiae]